MATKTWARLDAAITAAHPIALVLEITPPLDAALRPGVDIYSPSLIYVDATGIAGVAPGFTYTGSVFVAPAAATPSSTDLIAYANAKQVALRDGGINVNVGTTSTPDEVNVASDVNGRSLVTGCVQLIGLAAQTSQPAPTFSWINNGGTQLTLTAAQMMTLAAALGNFVQATYTALGAVLAAISAGTITTTAAIDAAAWPATSY